MTRKSKRPTLGELAAKGGAARAEVLTAKERSAIAKKAADARWAVVKGLPKETHAGVVKIGTGIPCSVLGNGMRVFSVAGLLRAFGSGAKSRARTSGGTAVPEFLSAKNLQPFISPELRSTLENTISFRPMASGSLGVGYEADILNLICDAVLDARKAGVLRPNQLKAAGAAEALVRAFSKVGVIALIDEATGYQYDRARDELGRLLDAYVVEDMRPWVSLFPGSFFKQVYRIHGWPYKEGVTQGPRYVGKFINKYVYERLPPNVLQRLRELNPVIDKRRRHKHFQFLSEDIGEPTVDRHLASVTTLMTVASDKKHFDEMFRLAFPRPGDQVLIGVVVNSPRALEEGAVQTAEDRSSNPELLPVGRAEVVAVRAALTERVLAFLRQHKVATFYDVAKAVYGQEAKARGSREERNTYQNLRLLLQRMERENLVESPRKWVWQLKS